MSNTAARRFGLPGSLRMRHDTHFVEGAERVHLPCGMRRNHRNALQPGQADQSATLFDHCALGLDQAIALTGADGMPLIGTGDWNDGMNRVGEGGKGTSVWLGWLLIATIDMMALLADARALIAKNTKK